ncbi:MAG: hypothetical protein AAFU70_14035, partial [Planctomycetota bacterium]
MNALPTLGAIAGLGGAVLVVTGTWYYATPDFFEVGYMPAQPDEGFNHQLHAGQPTLCVSQPSSLFSPW